MEEVLPEACAHYAVLLARACGYLSPVSISGTILYPVGSVLRVIDPGLDVTAARSRLVPENP